VTTTGVVQPSGKCNLISKHSILDFYEGPFVRGIVTDSPDDKTSGQESGVTRRAYLGGLAAALGTPAFAIEAAADTSPVTSGDSSATQTVSSPDGLVEFTIDVSGGSPQWSLTYDGETLIQPSGMGLSFDAQSDFGTGLTVTGTERSTTDTTWTPVWDQYDTIDEHYQELRVGLEEDSAPNRSLTVEVRAFDDGVGFRYVFPETSGFGTGEDSVVITAENTGFSFGGDYDAWWIPNEWDSYETEYRETTLSNLGGVDFRGETHEGANTPVTMRTGSGTHLAVHEAALTDYASMGIQPQSDGSTDFESVLCPLPDGSKVKTSGPRELPWRTVQVGQGPGDLVESSLVVNLNEPVDTSSGPFAPGNVGTDWIQPSKFMGVWWLMITGRADWEYLGDQTGNHGAQTGRAKRYMDFASEHGFESVLIEGWNEGWDSFGAGESELGSTMDFDQSYPDFDLQEVTSYGASLSPPVEMTMHNETSGGITNYESQINESPNIYSDYEDLGIRSIKTGYVADQGVQIDGQLYRHHSQAMVNHYQFTAEEAAKERQMLDIHEPIKPTGKRRTYPNLMTREGVFGQEYDSFTTITPEHHVTFPFTRMLGGPVEFTPGIFDLSSGNGGIETSVAKQLAMYPTFFSGLQMVADLPSSYLADQPATVSVGGVVQAEFGEVDGLPVAAEWANAQGGRYVGFDPNNATGSSSVTVTVEDVPSAGEYDLHLRYANDAEQNAVSEGTDRTATVRVNGSAATQVTVPTTAYWDVWASLSTTVSLEAGDNTVSVAIADGDTGGFNLDSIAVTQTGASMPEPATDPTLGPTKDAFEFVKQVPADWDDTVVVDAAIGDYSAMARQKDGEWYLGVMTDENARAVDVPLDFLSSGTWVAEIYADGPDASFPPGSAAEEVATYDRLVDASTTLSASLVASGGQAVRFRPADSQDQQQLDAYVAPDQSYDGGSVAGQAAIDEPLVSVTGSNAGNVVGGEELTVMVDGQEAATELVRFAPGTDSYQFGFSLDSPGTYDVEVRANGGATVTSGTVRVVRTDGRLIDSWSDPTGDDDGPGTYTYPTNGAFPDGIFDLTGVELYDLGDQYQLFYTLDGPIQNPFGGGAGYSLPFFQLYIRRPDAGGVASTTSGRAGTNVSFAEPYQYRVVATGFGTTSVEAADGSEVSSAVQTGVSGEAISITFPKAAVGGSLEGTEVAMLLLGQDGSGGGGPGNVRLVTETAGGFTFGGGTDGSDDPNVIDLIGAADQPQTEALSYTDGEPTIEYTQVIGPVSNRAAPPEDLDGDGAFEDVDGDGSKTYNDVVALFENSDSPAVEASGAFDFNANGRFDFNDIVRLFEELS
jgi:hypothetical protein